MDLGKRCAVRCTSESTPETYIPEPQCCWPPKSKQYRRGNDTLLYTPPPFTFKTPLQESRRQQEHGQGYVLDGNVCDESGGVKYPRPAHSTRSKHGGVFPFLSLSRLLIPARCIKYLNGGAVSIYVERDRRERFHLFHRIRT